MDTTIDHAALVATIRRSLRTQGFRIRNGTLLPPNDLSKERIRTLHTAAVEQRIERAKGGLFRKEHTLLRRIASGNEVVPSKIRPRLIEVSPGSEDELRYGERFERRGNTGSDGFSSVRRQAVWTTKYFSSYESLPSDSGLQWERNQTASELLRGATNGRLNSISPSVIPRVFQGETCKSFRLWRLALSLLSPSVGGPCSSRHSRTLKSS